jgi:8-oxo-dGTP pyrophosphatase MutT (NUDIX family)
MRNATLVLLINKKDNEICLGMKKRGFGASRWNGFGGKVKENESIEDAAIREIFEETSNEEFTSGIKIQKENLNKVALLTFIFPHQTEWNQQVHVFLVEDWEGEAEESEEMRPKWFKLDAIPYKDMWTDDIYWLPKILKGEKVNARFSFNENDDLINSEIKKYKISL